MSMEVLGILKTIVITIGIPLLAKYAGKFVNNEGRKFKVEFASQIVHGAIEVLKIQKGVSNTTALVFQEMVEAAKAALLANGFDPAKVHGIAEREVAKNIY